MNGMMITAVGIGMVALSLILFAASVVYRKTVGRRIRAELMREYD